MFSPLLVAPFSENEILEEQLAGGKAVWLLILKWRNASNDQTKCNIGTYSRFKELLHKTVLGIKGILCHTKSKEYGKVPQ